MGTPDSVPVPFLELPAKEAKAFFLKTNSCKKAPIWCCLTHEVVVTPQDGDEQSGAVIVSLGIARFEKMLEERFDGLVSVSVFDSLTGEQVSQGFELDENLVDKIVGTLTESMATNGAQDDTHPSDCDFFVARLRCHRCRNVSPEDDSTLCETFLRQTPDGSWLRVGSVVGPITSAHRQDYYAVNRAQNGALHIIEGWACPKCEHVNWAEIVVENETIRSIWSVSLNQETLKRANLLSSECVELAGQLADTPPWGLTSDDILRILHEKL